jgi:hypothetical protein
MLNKKYFYALTLILILKGFSISAQESEVKPCAPSDFSYNMIECMFNKMTIQDIATTPHTWAYSFSSPDKEKLQKFADALMNQKENINLHIGFSDGNYVVQVIDCKIFTAKSLFDRIDSLNSIAKENNVEGVKCFGLMEKG